MFAISIAVVTGCSGDVDQSSPSSTKVTRTAPAPAPVSTVPVATVAVSTTLAEPEVLGPYLMAICEDGQLQLAVPSLDPDPVRRFTIDDYSYFEGDTYGYTCDGPRWEFNSDFTVLLRNQDSADGGSIIVRYDDGAGGTDLSGPSTGGFSGQRVAELYPRFFDDEHVAYYDGNQEVWLTRPISKSIADAPGSVIDQQNQYLPPMYWDARSTNASGTASAGACLGNELCIIPATPMDYIDWDSYPPGLIRVADCGREPLGWFDDTHLVVWNRGYTTALGGEEGFLGLVTVDLATSSASCTPLLPETQYLVDLALYLPGDEFVYIRGVKGSEDTAFEIYLPDPVAGPTEMGARDPGRDWMSHLADAVGYFRTEPYTPTP